MKKFKKNAIRCMSFVAVASILAGFCVQSFKGPKEAVLSASAQTNIQKLNASVQTNQQDFYDDSVIYKLPDNVAETQDISVIVTMNTDSLMDIYNNTVTGGTVTSYVNSSSAKVIAGSIANQRKQLIKKLKKSGVSYSLGAEYDTVLSGFEITIKAKDFEKVGNLFENEASLIIGETYLPAETEVIHNDVDVYATGIFDTSNSEYQGDGVVVAVLDSGLDYTHDAFSVDNFTTTNEAFTLANVSNKVSQTVAAGFTSGLTGEDVYLNKKIPFAYDYADKDTDVLPTNSDHGTHVSGIILGKDDKITGKYENFTGKEEQFTGVAPNAQLAFMKVFSDFATGAKTSWLLAALEDCVNLGVDVVNMSLGSGCGFSREVDNKRVNEVYDSIRDAGISLVVSAGNAYNSAFGSEKNGNLGLTSNPDTATVGSPSTYAASMSVASVDGVKTPYILFNDQIIYFKEASTSSAKTKDFVDDILKQLGDNVQSHDFEYVTIPGLGRSSDYTKDASYYEGKIVLVKRGITTFEDKVRVALKEKGAAGIIIYNNVSGSISMSVGEDVGAVCSITQDEGEMLAKQGTGILRISRSQVAGPFMSDFSSWGPTSDLQIKPEITAHGGEILSAIPGHEYDIQSGTSMAAPNQSGATALIRQYVKYSGIFGANLTAQEVTKLVNQLMMSTTDIVMNKNGLPYAVRKQGSGLVNITKAVTSQAYIATFNEDGEMDKTKLELGDDKQKTGVYTMTFTVNNITTSSIAYDISSILITEGVSETYTSHSETTVTQEGYLLDEAVTKVTSVTGASQSGNIVTIGAKGSALVTVEISLSQAEKQYMNDSFAHGMFVEGFVKLTATSGATVDMSVPMLAFYGDWTEAPILDEEYYDTNADELNDGLDAEDKLMADAYATRAIGGLYSDYIATLGAYYFEQAPTATKIPASKEHIAISNQEDGNGSAINSLSYIWAGVLRNVKEANICIVEDSTGRVVYNKTEYNRSKSYSNGSSNMYYSSIDVDFKALEQNLKNNTKYTVTLTTYLDYGAKVDQKNVRNTFEFPLYIDFEAPIVTDVVYRKEYDKTTQKTKLFADLSVYDNHYAMGLQIGQITINDDPDSQYTFNMNTFGKYITPVYSSYNATSTVTIELTDYIAQLKNSAGIQYNADGTYQVVQNNNSFIVACYDYALNGATYEIRLPDEILAMQFNQDEIKLNPNETLDVSKVLNIYPSASWLEVLDFSSTDSDVVEVVNQTILAKQSGTATITATGYTKGGTMVTDTVTIKVLAEGEEGYYGGYTIPEVNKFTVTGYKVNKAYYGLSSADREIGVTGGKYEFASSSALSMFPSESVTLYYTLDSYFPNRTKVSYISGNPSVATVTDDGTIVAQAEGTTVINISVTFDDKPTLYSGRVSITVKDPFVTSAIYLNAYKGLGGEVIIPADRGITTINTYAFSNYEYVDKDLSAGDVIDDEDPYQIKQMYIGENTITKVVIPEGVTTIESYAFAKLTALEEVVLPTTLTRIGAGAFLGCEKLKTINLENVKFINEKAFLDCGLEEVEMDSLVAISNYAFQNCKLNYLQLPESAQSIGIGAFHGNKLLISVTFDASKVKIGSKAFENCVKLKKIDINAAVISSYAFFNCSDLTKVRFGKDVAVIGEYAFAGTSVSKFEFISKNNNLTLSNNGAMVYKGTELVVVAPTYAGEYINGSVNTVQLPTTTTAIAVGAFAGNNKIFKVIAQGVTKVGAYAFADCSNLTTATMPSLTEVGAYAFAGTALTQTPTLAKVTKIGDYAFALTKLTSVTLADATEVGAYAFAFDVYLESVTIGDDVIIGEAAFYCPVEEYTYDATGSLKYYDVYNYEVKDESGNVLETYSYYRYDYSVGAYSSLIGLTIGDNVTIGNYAFFGNVKLESVTFGDGAKIGDFAFYNVANLKSVHLEKATEIGSYAFSGASTQDFWLYNNTWTYAYELTVIDGEIYVVDYKYSTFAPSFKEVDLTATVALGEGAFCNNRALSNVVIGENIGALVYDEDGNRVMDSVTGKAKVVAGKLAVGTFAGCKALTNVVIPATVSELGDFAFNNSGVTTINLDKITSIGKYAFMGTSLKNVSLVTGVEVGDWAFAYCYDLSDVTNMEGISRIGAYAFMGAGLESVTLTNATYIGDFAFASSNVSEVVFGEKLVALGENPFFACAIVDFGKNEEGKLGDVIVEVTRNTTYDISETVKVIDGVLYQVVPKGLELVCYPLLKAGTEYVVEEGTVRISAKAFVGSSLTSVTLPVSLKAIGDKAFYACENLSVVVFKSYNAPILEEEYDTSYLTMDNLPIPGYMGEYEGLGISKYYMWNVTSTYSNFYFGANFVDYVGHIANPIVMVKPANGQNYNSFIFSQYFETVIQGNNAATDATLRVIALISAIPADITLDSETAIVAARTAYDALPSVEQKALVENYNGQNYYSLLTKAEGLLEYLKLSSQTPNEEAPAPVDKEQSKFVTFLKNNAVGLIIALCAVTALAVYIVVDIVRKKATKDTTEETENKEE